MAEQWLTTRHQGVLVNAVSSSTIPVRSGCAQGDRLCSVHSCSSLRPNSLIREFTQRRRRRHLEPQKSNRFRQAKQQLCTCITLFCTFLCRRCTTTTWNCLIWRFVEDGSKRQQLSFSFPKLWCSPLEFNSNQICQHLTH